MIRLDYALDGGLIGAFLGALSAALISVNLGHLIPGGALVTFITLPGALGALVGACKGT